MEQIEHLVLPGVGVAGFIEYGIIKHLIISEKIILCKTCSLFSFVFVIGGLFARFLFC